MLVITGEEGDERGVRAASDAGLKLGKIEPVTFPSV